MLLEGNHCRQGHAATTSTDVNDSYMTLANQNSNPEHTFDHKWNNDMN